MRCIDDAVLCKFGAQQIYQVHRTSLAAGFCTSKDGRTKQLLPFLFGNQMVLITLVNENRFFQIISEWNWRNIYIPFVSLTIPNISEVIICFHTLPMLSRKIKKKTMTALWNYCAATLIVFCAQRLLKFWRSCSATLRSRISLKQWLYSCYLTVLPIRSTCLRRSMMLYLFGIAEDATGCKIPTDGSGGSGDFCARFLGEHG